MLDRLKQRAEVIVFNRSPAATDGPRDGGNLQKIRSWWKLIQHFHRAAADHPSALYAGLSGGQGQLLDLPFFLLARWHDIPITVHHHSYAYLNRRSRLTALTFHAMGPARHIALCDDMQERLCRQYNLPKSRTLVLSNAAFMKEACKPAAEVPAARNQEQANEVSIGFLSNITAEKGIFDFFAAADAARVQSPDLKARIAGPVAPDIQPRFNQELAQRPWAEHIGPVYGQDKQDFFNSIDLLVFPTRYANEAEPVTILEALQAGVAVVAARRGCIGSMLTGREHCCDCCIEDIQKQLAAQVCEQAQMTTQARAQKRLDIAAAFENDATVARKLLSEITTDLTIGTQRQ